MECVNFFLDLAKGDSLAAFHWNTGGTWTNRPWDQDLPTDSQVSRFMLTDYPHCVSTDCYASAVQLYGCTSPAKSTTSQWPCVLQSVLLKMSTQTNRQKGRHLHLPIAKSSTTLSSNMTNNSVVYLMHTKLFYFEM